MRHRWLPQDDWHRQLISIWDNNLGAKSCWDASAEASNNSQTWHISQSTIFEHDTYHVIVRDVPDLISQLCLCYSLLKCAFTEYDAVMIRMQVKQCSRQEIRQKWTSTYENRDVVDVHLYKHSATTDYLHITFVRHRWRGWILELRSSCLDVSTCCEISKQPWHEIWTWDFPRFNLDSQIYKPEMLKHQSYLSRTSNYKIKQYKLAYTSARSARTGDQRMLYHNMLLVSTRITHVIF